MWHVGLYRDPSTKTTVEYYNRFEDDAGAGLCKVAYILDFCLSCGEICMYVVCIYCIVCMYVCIVCIVYIACIYVCVCMHSCHCVSVSISVSVSVMYVFLYVRMSVHTHTHTHTHTRIHSHAHATFIHASKEPLSIVNNLFVLA